MRFSHSWPHTAWMTRSESFLLKVQVGELEVDRLSWSEVVVNAFFAFMATHRIDEE